MDAVAAQVASALRLPAANVLATLRLLGDGATVPFIVRYRKEATGALDEVAVRAVAEAAEAAEALAARKRAVLKAIAGGPRRAALTPALCRAIESCATLKALPNTIRSSEL